MCRSKGWWTNVLCLYRGQSTLPALNGPPLLTMPVFVSPLQISTRESTGTYDILHTKVRMFFLLIRKVWLTPVLHEASKLTSSFSPEKPENCSTFLPSQRFRVNFTKLVEKSGLSFALFSKMSVWCLPGFISQNSQVPSPQLLKQPCSHSLSF